MTAPTLVPALAVFLLGAGLCLGPAPSARAQVPASEERLKILTDPEDIKKKLEKDKEKTRPPIEMSRSQVAPFDILPFIKAKHWATISLEIRANYEDYAGTLQTVAVPLLDHSDRPLPQEMIYSRDARLPKTQQMKLGLQVLLPKIPLPPRNEITLELLRPEAIRYDEAWPAPLRVLEPHQMLIVVLTKESSDAYASWNRLQALYPNALERGDVTLTDKLRYYRLVLPLDTEKPPLSPHPLTWTTISHVVWDGMPPDTLNPSQQQAMLDWLHWGGQLTFSGARGPLTRSSRTASSAPTSPPTTPARTPSSPARTSPLWRWPTRRSTSPSLSTPIARSTCTATAAATTPRAPSAVTGARWRSSPTLGAPSTSPA